MAKITLSNLTTLANETAAVALINSNMSVITAAWENNLSRDGTSPNSLSSQIDMNSNKIINLTPGSATGEAVAYEQLAELLADIDVSTAAAAASAVAAASSAATATTQAGLAGASATNAATSYTNTLALYNAINNYYLGAFPNDPVLDNDGSALEVGDFYYNTTSGEIRIWNGSTWTAAIGTTSTATLTNKTINLTSNTLVGTTAQFNTALSDDDFATLTNTVTLTNKTLTAPVINAGTIGTSLIPTTDAVAPLGSLTKGYSGIFFGTAGTINFANSNWVATHSSGILTVGTGDLRVTTAGTNSASVATVGGTQTLTAKTLNLTSNTLSGTTAQFNTALSDNDFATLAGSETLTTKTINLSNNTLTGTTAQFNTALSDNDFATLAGSETLTNKTLTSPVINAPTVGTSFLATANNTVALGSAAVNWTSVFLGSGGTINFNNGNWVATHSSGILTVSTGDLRVTTAGTNSASVVTVGGTQTLTSKTLTSPIITTGSLSNPTSTGTDTVSEAFVLSGDISPAQITADQNDYAPTGFSTASTLRINSDATRTITSLAGGSDGRIIIIVNNGGFNIVLEDASASGTAANKFDLGASLILTPKDACILRYDATVSRWMKIATTGTGGGGGGAPSTAQYIVAALDATLSAERAGTDTATIAWDFGTASQAKLNVVNSSITLAKMESGTQGDLLYYAGSGTPTRLSAGTAGQYLKTGGAGANPSWGTVTTPTIQVFTASGTWTRPSGCTKIKATILGGGGGAGSVDMTGSLNTAATGGAGAGATCISYVDVTSLSSLTVTVGAAGTAGATGGSGGNGGTSGLGTSNAQGQATGGTGTAGETAGASNTNGTLAGGAGGVATNGNVLIPGSNGGASYYNDNSSVALSGPGGGSTLGSGAPATSISTSTATINGVSANVYGAGGSGAAAINSGTATTGGAGAQGIVIIEEYYA